MGMTILECEWATVTPPDEDDPGEPIDDDLQDYIEISIDGEGGEQQASATIEISSTYNEDISVSFEVIDEYEGESVYSNIVTIEPYGTFEDEINILYTVDETEEVDLCLEVMELDS